MGTVTSRPPSSIHRFLAAAGTLAVVASVFVFGVAVGARKWPPYGALKALRNSLRSDPLPAPYMGEAEILKFAFTDPLLRSEMVRSPISSLDGITEANQSLFVDAAAFPCAFGEIELLEGARFSLDEGATPLLRVRYGLRGREYEAFAYAPETAGRGRAAALIIPGSGQNQSDAIRKRVKESYHRGILDAFPPGVDAFVFIKPNEDCLAFHDGTGKLSRDFVFNWHINHGGSYSVSYIAQSLALMKYLRREYPVTVVAGLSQGGMAALLNALQSKPDAALIASGFSVLSDRVRSSSHDQILIPGYWSYLALPAIRARIMETPTRFLFMYGASERGTYRIEAEDHLTEKALGDLANVRFEVHPGGHVFPAEAARRFLEASLAP